MNRPVASEPPASPAVLHLQGDCGRQRQRAPQEVVCRARPQQLQQQEGLLQQHVLLFHLTSAEAAAADSPSVCWLQLQQLQRLQFIADGNKRCRSDKLVTQTQTKLLATFLKLTTKHHRGLHGWLGTKAGRGISAQLCGHVTGSSNLPSTGYMTHRVMARCTSPTQPIHRNVRAISQRLVMSHTQVGHVPQCSRQ